MTLACQPPCHKAADMVTCRTSCLSKSLAGAWSCSFGAPLTYCLPASLQLRMLHLQTQPTLEQPTLQKPRRLNQALPQHRHSLVLGHRAAWTLRLRKHLALQHACSCFRPRGKGGSGHHSAPHLSQAPAVASIHCCTLQLVKSGAAGCWRGGARSGLCPLEARDVSLESAL